MIRNVTWNLFLAGIPVLLGYALAWGLHRVGKQPRLPALVTGPLALCWLLFLPNTCYLLTEWRHLLFDDRWADVLDIAHRDKQAMLSVAKWGLFFALYSGMGVLLLALSIRPMERWWAARKSIPIPVVAPFFFLLLSLGVYLGLLPRLNSWDVFVEPLRVLSIAWSGIRDTQILVSILLFGFLLWAIYEAVDLWVDGIATRMRKWGFLPSRGE